MRTQYSQEIPPTCCQGKFHLNLKGRKSNVGIIQGKLRICSMPGAFLVLGLIVVVIGTSLAVAGYWPYRMSKTSIMGLSEADSISEPQSSGWRLGAKGHLSSASLIHNERLKLMGPVIVGVGLFILICANTVLYENRDRETKILRTQMRSVMYTVSTSIPSAEITAASSKLKNYPWIQTSPAPCFNKLYLHKLATSEPLLQTPSSKDQQDYQQAIHQHSVLHNELEPPSTLHSFLLNSCNSSQTEISITCMPKQGGNTDFSPKPSSFI